MLYGVVMINWSHIDTVLLDMDGTLLDLHFDNHFWLEHLPLKFSQHKDITLDQAKAHLFENFDSLQGTLNWYCLDFWTDELGLDIPQLKEDIQHKIGYRPLVKDFLQALKVANKSRILVTNAHRDSLDLKLKNTDLGDHLDIIVSAHDYQKPKEQQAFWQQLQQAHPFDVERTLLIDDSLSVLASAKQYGIKHLLCISKPDSQKPIREISEFSSVVHFSDIMPNNNSEK
jgi:putative hydrolase of the HAD superfamily